MAIVNDSLAVLLKQINYRGSDYSTRKFIVFYGPPCSGKTTLSKLLSSEYQTQRISMDIIRNILIPGQHDFSDKTLNRKLFDLLVQYCDSILNSGTSVICEATLIAEERKAAIRQIGMNNSVNVNFIYTTAPYELLLKRLMIRIEKGKNSEGYIEMNLTPDYLKFFSDSSLPPADESIIIDTSKTNIEEAYKEVKKIIL